MTPSVFCTIGPFFPTQFAEGTNDLTRDQGKVASGQHIFLSGRVLEKGGKATLNTIVEIWQPDAEGIFRHPLDARSAQADPGFFGWGRARTDSEGRYRFRTVLPGAYEGRAPHVNLMLLAIGLTRRLVTTVFFSEAGQAEACPTLAGQAEACPTLAVRDPVLDCVDASRRPRLFAQRDPSADALGALAYRFDIVLHGDSETPFFLD
jgi:protocatechuate 3,4-dioxygenase beta subunit